MHKAIINKFIDILLTNRGIFLFLVAVVFIYSFLSFGVTSGNIFSESFTPYYSYLVRSFLSKDLYLKDIASTYDLSWSTNGLTMYWGLGPVVFILPFWLLGGIARSDIFYTLCAGILNVSVFILLINQVDEYLNLKASVVKKLLLVSFVAISSPNLYLSLAGRIWHTSQIISIFYLLLFLLFYFKYLNLGNKINLFLSSLFLALAVISRSTLVVYGILFFYPLRLMVKSKNNLKLVAKTFIIMALPLVSGLLVFFSYNYVRYGSIWETGIGYQLSDPRFSEAIKGKKYFSFTYFNNNFGHYFLDWVRPIAKSPFVKFDPFGNSVFSVYPFVLLAPFSFLALGFWKKSKRLLFNLLWLVVVISTFCLLVFMGTGWTEFGSRYFFDVVPAILLLGLPVAKRTRTFILLLLLLYGGWVNIFGSILFYKLY